MVRKFTQVAWKNCYKTIYHGQSAALKNAGPQVLRGYFIAHDRKTDSRGWVQSSGWMLDLDFLLSLAVPTLNGSIRRPGSSVPGTQIPRSDLFQVPI